MRRALLIDAPTRRWSPVADPRAAAPALPFEPDPDRGAGGFRCVGLLVSVQPGAVDPKGTAMPGLADDLARKLPEPHRVRPTVVHLGGIVPTSHEGIRVCDVVADYVTTTGALVLLTCDEPRRLRDGTHRLGLWRRLFLAAHLRVRETEE